MISDNLIRIILNEKTLSRIRLDAWDDLVRTSPTPQPIKEVIEAIAPHIAMYLWTKRDKGHYSSLTRDLVAQYIADPDTVANQTGPRILGIMGGLTCPNCKQIFSIEVRKQDD